MKKVFLVLTLVFTLLSCSKSPVNYEIPNIIENSDWVKRTREEVTTPEYGVRKKVLLSNFLDNPLIKSDSLELEISQVSLEEIKRFPEPLQLKKIIEQVFENCKSSCKNEATFKPYKISITFINAKPPKEPSKEDILRVREDWSFEKEYPEFYERSVNNALNDIRKGRNDEFIINVDFLASNAYGTPGELFSIMSYDLKKGVLDYHGATER